MSTAAATLSVRWERRWIGALVGYLAVLAFIDTSAYLGIIPTKLAHVPYYDTFGHLFLIGLAGFFTHRAMARRAVRVLGIALPLGMLVVATLAGIEELLQNLSPLRESSIWDFAADVVGISAFGVVDAWLARRRHQEET